MKKGGNAADAALAACITQTVVEPHMTTITGCLSLLYYDAASGKTTYLNGNVNAPLEPLPGFSVADLATGRGVAVPGWWAGFEAGLAKHGTLEKKDIMSGAIRYAREGFETHPFLWGEVFAECHLIGRTAEGREISTCRSALFLAPERCSIRGAPRTRWNGWRRKETTTSITVSSPRISWTPSKARAGC